MNYISILKMEDKRNGIYWPMKSLIKLKSFTVWLSSPYFLRSLGYAWPRIWLVILKLSGLAGRALQRLLQDTGQTRSSCPSSARRNPRCTDLNRKEAACNPAWRSCQGLAFWGAQPGNAAHWQTELKKTTSMEVVAPWISTVAMNLWMVAYLPKKKKGE